MNTFVKGIRCSRGYSQTKIAEIMGISIKDYARIENNSIDNMSIGDCKKMIKHLEINPLEFISLLDPQHDPL